jgi:Xaa-Pro aminopeptidase
MAITYQMQQLKGDLQAHECDALLVTKELNISYLTGYPSSDSWLLITKKKIFYLTDSRYGEEIRKALPWLQVIVYKSSMNEALFPLLAKSGDKVLGFDDRHITLNQYKIMQKFCPKSISLKSVNGLVEALRESKSRHEIEEIRRGLKIHKKALQLCREWIKPGVTEWDIFYKLKNYIIKNKAEFSFPPIIASGPNSSYPHASVTERKILKNDIVMTDFGIDVNGYKTDLTRIFFLGRIRHSYRNVEVSVRQAQRTAIAKIEPGVAAASIDNIAREFLKKQKLNSYFTHSLGHGVGLEIHEDPRLSIKSKAVLKPGMVVTVEPGVYFPGRFGIRIEDMVLVTEKGNEVLSECID